MERRSAICRQELSDWGSLLTDSPREMPYALPAGYFESVVLATLQHIQEADADNRAPIPGREIQLLAPRLAAADRAMPFQAPPLVGLPRVTASLRPAQTVSSPEDPKETLPKIRQWKPLRVAAAWLLLGMATWLLRLQTQPAALQDTSLTLDTSLFPLESVDEASLTGYLVDTEAGSERIGREASWEEAVQAIVLGDMTCLDSSLAALPAATLLAFANETSLSFP